MKNTRILLAVVCLMITSAEIFAQNRETRNLTGITKGEFRLPGKPDIKQGSAENVEIEASKDLLSRIDTDNEGSRLINETKDKYNWRSGDDVKVYVTVKNLEGLGAAGSGDVIGESKFTTNDVSLRVSGSGSMKIEVESSGEVEANVSGSGELNVKGSAKSFDSSVSGSGRVAMQMNVSGSSDLNI